VPGVRVMLLWPIGNLSPVKALRLSGKYSGQRLPARVFDVCLGEPDHEERMLTSALYALQVPAVPELRQPPPHRLLRQMSVTPIAQKLHRRSGTDRDKRDALRQPAQV